MRTFVYGLAQLVGVALVAVGVGLWSVPAALVVLGVLLVMIGEVRA